MLSITSHDHGNLSKVASSTRDGLFSRFCAALVESRRQTAEAVISRYSYLLPRNHGQAGHNLAAGTKDVPFGGL